MKKLGKIRNIVLISSVVLLFILPFIKSISDFNRYIMAALISISGLKLVIDFLLKLPMSFAAYDDSGSTTKTKNSRRIALLFGLFLLFSGFHWIFFKL